MTKKKIIIVVVSLGVAAALVGGCIGGYRWYQSQNVTAEVDSVSNLNWYSSGDEMNSSGIVTNDTSQNVYLLEEHTVSEIFVKEGQTVAVGDPLMSYDMTMSNLELEMKKLDIDTANNKLEAAKVELQKLKNTAPIPDAVPEPPAEEPEPPAEDPAEPDPGPEKDGDAFNYISVSSKPNDGKGSMDDPYIFLCMPKCYVYGEYLNSLSADKKKPVYVIFEIRKGNKEDGKLIYEWKVSGESGLPKMADDSKWAVKTKSQIEDSVIEEPEPEPEPEDPVIEEPEAPQGYTAAELAKMIREKEEDIRDLDLEKRKAELELDQMQKLSGDGVVLATVNGTVKTVGDKDNPPKDGSAFILVSGSDGLYVTSDLSELVLNDVKVGQKIYVNSWETGMSYEAEITEISTYPRDGNSFWGEGNPNVSYYPYTAYIENTEGLKNGESVSLTLNNTTEASSSVYLQKAYIREENGKYYVLKADKNNRLVKQYVETGKSIWGEAMEIVSGLTQEDRIAFPYGKTAKEGVKVKEASGTATY